MFCVFIYIFRLSWKKKKFIKIFLKFDRKQNFHKQKKILFSHKQTSSKQLYLLSRIISFVFIHPENSQKAQLIFCEYYSLQNLFYIIILKPFYKTPPIPTPTMSNPTSTQSPLLLILGGTGLTGQETVKAALKEGYQVRSITRNVSKAPQFEQGKVEWLEGSATDPETLKKALSGVEGVISTIGPDGLGKTTLYSDSAKVIISAMKEAKVNRLVVVTSERVSPSLGWFKKKVMWTLLGNLLKDIERMEEMFEKLNDKDIEWTIVRPFRLKNGPLTGKYRVGPSDMQPPFLNVSYRSDLGEFLVKEYKEKKWNNQFVSMGM